MPQNFESSKSLFANADKRAFTANPALCTFGFSNVIKKTVELGYIVNNPCNYAELPRQNKKETKAFSPKQAQEFLECMKDTRHGLVFEIALSSGMRPEEYLSLCWKDIDFEKSTATVQHALVWRRGNGFKFCEPKTAKYTPNSSFTKIKFYRVLKNTNGDNLNSL